MKKTFSLLLISCVCNISSQVFVNSFMGNYNCLLKQTNVSNGQVNTFYNITVTLTASVADTSEFTAYDGIALHNNDDYTLYSDSTFKDSTFAFNYGNFYSDSIYIYTFSPAGSGGVLSEYFGKKIVTNYVSHFFVDNIKIFPNPASEKIIVDGICSVKSISIVDLNGREIKLDCSENEIDISLIEDGFYILKIGTANGVITRRIEIRKR